MSASIIWTSDEDEILITFVKDHEALYNTKHRDYRKAQLKLHLWASIGASLEKSGTDCFKRWAYVRDYYIRRKGKPGIGIPGEAARRRASLLSFLDRINTSGRSTTTNVEKQTYEEANAGNREKNDMIEDDVTLDDIKEDKRKMSEDLIRPIKQKIIHSEEQLPLFRDITQQKATAPQNELDEADLFFNSMAKIYKRLPCYEQAQLRVDITNLISNAELRTISREHDTSRPCSTPKT